MQIKGQGGRTSLPFHPLCPYSRLCPHHPVTGTPQLPPTLPITPVYLLLWPLLGHAAPCGFILLLAAQGSWCISLLMSWPSLMPQRAMPLGPAGPLTCSLTVCMDRSHTPPSLGWTDPRLTLHVSPEGSIGFKPPLRTGMAE